MCVRVFCEMSNAIALENNRKVSLSIFRCHCVQFYFAILFAPIPKEETFFLDEIGVTILWQNRRSLVMYRCKG